MRYRALTNAPHLFVTYVGLLCASRTPTPTETVKPGDLGYKSVDGIVYDATVGPALPIAGAQVDYTHSSLVIPGSTGTVIADAQGRFGLLLLLHDTDTIVVQATAAGFRPHSVQFSGLQLWFDVERVELGLEPVLTHTVTPTPTKTIVVQPTPSTAAQTINPPPVRSGGSCDVTTSDPHAAADLIFLGLPVLLLRRRIRPIGNRLSKEGLP